MNHTHGSARRTGTFSIAAITTLLSVTGLAVAADYQLAVGIAGPGTGTVTSSPPGISCPASCLATFPEGTSVTLTAAANVGSELGSWSGECGGSGTCAFSMGSHKGVFAAFKPLDDPYTVRRHLMGGRADGRVPAYGAPVSDGTFLYGMTPDGGPLDRGVIFRSRLDGTEYILLHTFLGGAGDGSMPYGSLLLDGGVLYGMTSRGGAHEVGTVFKVDTDGTGFTLLYSFAGECDGAYPYGSLTPVAGALYGMTMSGGAYGSGTVFTISPDGTAYGVLRAFDYAAGEGRFPYGSLTASGEWLCGMTESGGTTYPAMSSRSARMGPSSQCFTASRVGTGSRPGVPDPCRLDTLRDDPPGWLIPARRDIQRQH